MKVDGCEIVTNAAVYGLEDSIRRAKFPMAVDTDALNETLTDGIAALAQSGMGEGHDNWLCGIVVQFDLTFTVKAWTEFERYHFADIISSQSSMHRLTRFDFDTVYCDHVDRRIIDIMKQKQSEYNDAVSCCDLERAKQLQLELLYSNPNGCKLTAGITTNYRQLKTIYRQRRHHLLPEWRMFTDWIETLPHSELICEKRTKEA